MKATLYLPKKIKVGFQNRSDTYTGKLAYVIYYDSKGVLRKEQSWQSWRNKDIEPQDFDNVPTEGIVLNKKVGDYSCHWNHRQAYTRVYDPRGFEFEITIENLLYILENTSAIKGKGLEGEFVYTWNGVELVLMPTCAPDFKEITEYNEVLQSNKKFNTKNMVIGGTYRTSGNDEVVYMGKYPVYGEVYAFDGKIFSTYRKMERYAEKVDKATREYVYVSGYRYKPVYKNKIGVTGKEFWFACKREDDSSKWRLYHQSSASNIIDVIDESCHPEYAEIFDLMEREEDYSPYDKSRDEIVYYTWEELLKASDEQAVRCNIEVNGTKYFGYFRIEDDDEHTVHLATWGNDYEIQELFKKPGSWEFKRMPLRYFLDTYHPYYRKLYLVNGKFWKLDSSLWFYETEKLKKEVIA